MTGENTMSEGVEKSYHFNSNMRSNSGSKSTMSNNEDRYLRALEIQERKQAIIDNELEKQRDEEGRLAALAPKPEENTAVVEEAAQSEEASETDVIEETAPVVEKEVPTPIAVKSSGTNVPGPTPRNDFTSAEKSAMLKRARAHAAEVAKRKS
ncbi:MAG: hypothetical protein ACI8PD_000707 [Nitrospinales bacterium]